MGDAAAAAFGAVFFGALAALCARGARTWQEVLLTSLDQGVRLRIVIHDPGGDQVLEDDFAAGSQASTTYFSRSRRRIVIAEPDGEKTELPFQPANSAACDIAFHFNVLEGADPGRTYHRVMDGRWVGIVLAAAFGIGALFFGAVTLLLLLPSAR